ncbi:MAG: response regulator [Verrucomicrobia bacterium]|nr:response regulator [Verrucomicrobiota bacterium]
MIAKKDSSLRFGAAVKRLRNRLRISQETLAERAGLDRTYIGHVERGVRNVSLSTIDKLARALEVSAATLLSGSSDTARMSGGPYPEMLETCVGTDCVGRGRVDILLVEDNHSDVGLTLRAFKKAGVTNPVHVVRDGAEALEFLFCSERYSSLEMQDRPRLVLLDLNLPKVSGLEVLRRIKADARTRNIPVVVLTASRRDESFAEARRLGAAAYIIKPVDFWNLSEVTPKLRLHWALVQPAEELSA